MERPEAAFPDVIEVVVEIPRGSRNSLGSNVVLLDSITECRAWVPTNSALGTTWLAVRVFYPALLASGTPSLREQRQLSEIPQQSSYYVAIAAVVPMLAMLLVLFAAPENRLLAGLLIVAGLIGFVTAWLVFGRIRDDVAALSVATRAADSLGIGTETAEGL